MVSLLSAYPYSFPFQFYDNEAHTIPVKNFEDYNKFPPPKGTKAGHIFDKMIPPQEIRAKLDQIKGHLVWMPLDFLKDAQMAEGGIAVNAWTESIYT